MWFKKGLRVGGHEVIRPMTADEIRELKEQEDVERRHKLEEREATHQGKLKYLRRQASHGGGGGFFGGFESGLGTIAKNAASTQGHSMFGGGPGFDPIRGGHIAPTRPRRTIRRPSRRRMKVIYY